MYDLCCGLHVLLQVFPFPGKDETYQVPFTRVVYIEQDDFREQDQKKYFGLAPGKSVLLRCHTSHTLLLAHLHGPRPAQRYHDQHSGEIHSCLPTCMVQDLLKVIMTTTHGSFNLLLLGLSA